MYSIFNSFNITSASLLPTFACVCAIQSNKFNDRATKFFKPKPEIDLNKNALFQIQTRKNGFEAKKNAIVEFSIQLNVKQNGIKTSNRISKTTDQWLFKECKMECLFRQFPFESKEKDQNKLNYFCARLTRSSMVDNIQNLENSFIYILIPKKLYIRELLSFVFFDFQK